MKVPNQKKEENIQEMQFKVDQQGNQKTRKGTILQKELKKKSNHHHTFFSSSLLYPKIANLSWAAVPVRPSLVHLKFSKTSSMGIFSCNYNSNKKGNKPIKTNKKFSKKKLIFLVRSITKSTVSFKTASNTSGFSPILLNFLSSYFKIQENFN